MIQVVVAVVVVGAALVVAVLLQRRRRPDAPSQPADWTVPAQLDRGDFPRAELPWLVAIFTASSCHTCQGVVDAAQTLASADTAVAEIEVAAQPELHRRYHIDAVPITVMADQHGVVHRSFAGPVAPGKLRAALSALQHPNGSAPSPGL